MNVASLRLLIADVTKTRFPHTMGLECARPGTLVFQAMFWPLGPSHLSGSRIDGALPAANAPRNEGQLVPIEGPCAASAAEMVMAVERTTQGMRMSMPGF